MTTYQKELDDLIAEKHWVLVNKSKKIGITESVLRSIAMRIFHDYKGMEVMLCAGNREKHAISLMARFRPLLKTFEDRIIEETNTHLKLQDNTEINAYPSNAEATVGRPNVICVYEDEASYTGILEDQPVFENLFANISNTNGDFIITSTPNMRRGFFHDMCQNVPEGWFYKEWDYTHGLNAGLLDAEFIAKVKKDPRVDFDKLYRCKFPKGRLSPIGEDLIESQEKAEYEFAT